MLFSSVLSVFALVAGVSAHGYVSEITFDGKTYKGPVAGGAKIKSPVRQISTTSPFKDVNGAGMTCGRNAQAASIVAPVTAGSTVSLKWLDHPGDTWNHDMGPLITYMAKVPAGQTADKFNPSSADFFKVAQAGLEGGKWPAQAKLTTGGSHSFTVPKGIQNGDYIIRHEIIALHLANQRGGVEFYTSCIQVRVSGGSAGAVTPSATAKFPGGYKLTDAGIFTPKIFDGGFKYTFPGPAIAKFSGGAATVKNTSTANNTTTSNTSTSGSGKTTTGNTSSGKSTTGSVKTKCRRAVAGWTSRMTKRITQAAAPVSE